MQRLQKSCIYSQSCIQNIPEHKSTEFAHIHIGPHYDSNFMQRSASNRDYTESWIAASKTFRINVSRERALTIAILVEQAERFLELGNLLLS